MSTGNIIFLAGMFVAAICVSASAFAKRHGDIWSYYHFDGLAFVSGQSLDGGLFVAVRDQMQPVVVTNPSQIEANALPTGKGVVAGICYIQNSGGKLTGNNGFNPSSGTPVQISGKRADTEVSCGSNGYFVSLLDVGEYVVTAGPARMPVVVEAGKTTLLSLRTGKRMVD